jgi:predicted Zn finger-like uncharacterized protein
MSLVTRCPACETTFKVVKDQLRISDGWVRCGRCSEVFDATIELREAPESTPALTQDVKQSADVGAEVESLDDLRLPTTSDGDEPLSEAEPSAPSEPEQEVPHAGSLPEDDPWADSGLLDLGDEGRTAVRPPLPPRISFPDIDLSLSAPAPAPVAAAAAAGAPALSSTEPRSAEDVANAQLQKALRRARVKSAKIAKAKAREQKAAAVEAAPLVLAASEPEQPVEVVRGTPSFMGMSGAEGFWQRPSVRRSMLAVAVLAAVLLVVQVAYQERDLIVARQPGMRPAIASMCGLLGCEISALRQINDIKVDGASFSREKSDEGFHLSFTLRNTADVPLAMPAVELSLLDTQERAVVRRVLSPSEFGAPSVLPARAERAASLSLKLTGPEAAAMPPVAGFRVETLYP